MRLATAVLQLARAHMQNRRTKWLNIAITWYIHISNSHFQGCNRFANIKRNRDYILVSGQCQRIEISARPTFPFWARNKNLHFETCAGVLAVIRWLFPDIRYAIKNTRNSWLYQYVEHKKEQIDDVTVHLVKQWKLQCNTWLQNITKSVIHYWLRSRSVIYFTALLFSLSLLL